MPRVKMKTDCAGSNDGKTVRTYFKGGVYDLSEHLAESFTNKDRSEKGAVAEMAPKAKLNDPAPEAETENEVEEAVEAAETSRKMPGA